jgi:threonine/homoserine/homoserine lactone efflux protein
MSTIDTFGFIIMGALFGFTAGISPGPLLTLVISETITHGKSEGIKVAVAPLITDLPIITIAFLIFSRYSQFNILMGLISFLGGLFLVYLGWECLKTKGLEIEIQNRRSESLIKGIIVNILNPHPYLFWVTVGTPVAIKAYQASLSSVILFFITFYAMLLGSKISIALIVERSKTLLTKMVYIWIMRILGLSLFIFAVLFFIDSIKVLISISNR